MVKKLLLTFITLSVFIFVRCNSDTRNKTSNVGNITESSTDKKNENLSGKSVETSNLLYINNDGDTILYYQDKKFILKNPSGTKAYGVGYGINGQYQKDNIFFSEAGNRIYYLDTYHTPDTFYSGIKEINISEGITYDLAQRLSIKDCYLVDFSYCDGYILSSTVKIDGASSNSPRENIIINLKNNNYKTVTMPKLSNVDYMKSFMYVNGQILIFYTHDNYKNRGLMVADSSGKIVKNYPNINCDQANLGISFVKVSPDGKYLLCSFGQTPINLYLYSIENNKSYEIIGEPVKAEGRSIANWNDNNSFYYKTFSMEANRSEKLYKKYILDVISK